MLNPRIHQHTLLRSLPGLSNVSIGQSYFLLKQFSLNLSATTEIEERQAK